MNKKAQKFKGREVKQAVEQADANQQSLSQMRQVVYGLSYTVLQHETTIRQLANQLAVVTNRARNADFRSAALAELLMEGAVVTKEAITDRFVKLQLKEFQEGSDLHDQEQELEAASGPAEAGMHAILTAKLFKDGVEQSEEQVLRSKIELGKDELFKTLDQVLIGLNIGDVRRATVETDYGLREVEVTLLGLRKSKPQTQEASSQAQG